MKVKRLLISVLLSSVALLMSVSCNKNETTKEKPVITLETSELSFTNEGGTLSAGFSIQNPVEEVFLKYESSETPEWILSVNCDEAKEGKFTVTVDKNTTTLAREYSIVLTYPDAADAVIKISQEAGEEEPDDTFSIKVHHESYYNSADVIALAPFYEMAGFGSYDILFPIVIEDKPEGSATELYYAIIDATQGVENITDDDVLRLIQLLGKQGKANVFMASYNMKIIVGAMAIDAQGNKTKLYRSDVIELTKDGADSDASKCVTILDDIMEGKYDL